MPDWKTLFGELRAFEAVAWIVAVAVLIGIVVKLWPFIRNAVEIVDALVRLPTVLTTMKAMQAQIGEIHHEVNFNNGSSVKDATKRLEEAVARIDDGVTGLYEKVDELAAVDDKLWDTLGGSDDE